MKIPKIIKTELLERMQIEQTLRKKWEENLKNELFLDEVRQVDRDNTMFLKKIIARYGWPKISDVGKDVAEAAWLIAQHSPDKDFLRNCLKLMQQNPKEVEPFNLARSVDRVRIYDGKQQYYGTHFTRREEDGPWKPMPIEDEENVDVRRSEIGQPTIKEKLKELNG